MASRAAQYDADYLTRVSRVREGVPVADAVEVMRAWSIPVARFATVLGVSERQWGRARSGASNATLSPVASDRLMRVVRVFDHAKTIFDNQGNAVEWFVTSNPALSGEAPLSLLDTDAGVHEVDDVLTRLEFGVYA